MKINLYYLGKRLRTTQRPYFGYRRNRHLTCLGLKIEHLIYLWRFCLRLDI